MNTDCPIITVKWYDHWMSEINVCFTDEEIKAMARRVVRETTGYLVYEDRFVIGVAGTVEEDNTKSDINWFMKRAILSRSDKQQRSDK